MECTHYTRNCKIICAECDKSYDCRLCHDHVEADIVNNLANFHEIDRFAITEIICKICNLRQPKSNKCISEECDTIFGTYYCETCCLYDEFGHEKNIFHCQKCGICRLGPKENYFHCDNCNTCLGISLKDSHVCNNIGDEMCPVCSEDLHSSVNPFTKMKCGHWIHSNCLNSMIQEQKYTCPFCYKLFIDAQGYNTFMDSVISNVVMPDEYKDKMVDIICNECLTTSNVSFNFYGHKCLNEECNSYNTKLV
jgi:RING finger/CHY zinc finger protein 1